LGTSRLAVCGLLPSALCCLVSKCRTDSPIAAASGLKSLAASADEGEEEEEAAEPAEVEAEEEEEEEAEADAAAAGFAVGSDTEADRRELRGRR
jgi:hypothetical protein